MPDVYDRCLGPSLFAPFGAHLGAAAAAFAPVRVLELAAGTGIATRELVRALPSASIAATDLNPSMVAWAASRVPGATWGQADAQALPMPDGSFDLVVCQFGAMFFADKPAAFAEMARVLAPGGHVVLVVWDRVELSPFPRALVEGVRAVLPENPPDFVARVPHGYNDLAQVKSDIEAGGLVDVAIDRVVMRGTASSADQLAEGFCMGTPLRFDLEQRGDLAALRDAVAGEMTARLGQGPIEGDLAAIQITAARR
ncbi:MAG: ubiE 4 [Pseudonocardiales bacterium]|nr:ubiE 4 [Pseudonocardiales bacterium]